MNEYTTKSGAISIIPSGMGGYTIHYLAGAATPEDDIYVPGNAARALHDFFRAEDDERLGRWRWPDNTDYLVYEDEGGDVAVFNELKATVSSLFIQRDLSQRNPNHPATQAARAYFDAHPEPKPWHNAKPGEVWALTVDGEESAFYPSKSLDRAFTPVAPETGRTAVSMESFEITAGRRIYPEPS